MKRLLIILAFLFSTVVIAQKNYTVNGETYSLSSEVEGELTLLWTTINDEYRYFSKKGNDIVELINTKVDKKYQEEYKGVLSTQTADYPVSLDGVNLNLASLRKFYIDYNTKADPNFNETSGKIKLSTRLGFFAGMTNYPFFINPDNTFVPQVGVDFEIIDEVILPSHSVVFQFRQLFGSSDYDISSSQLSINYRFKFIKSENVAIFVNTKLASYVYIKSDISYEENNGETINIRNSDSDFLAPFTLGLGADIALGNGFLTLGIYDAVAINLEHDEFPIDIVAGYKIKL